MPRTYTNPDTGITQPLPPDDDDDDDEKEPDLVLQADGTKVENENLKLFFGRLRKVHRVAEKANEAALVLRQNLLTLSQLSQYYRSFLKRNQFPTDLTESCKDAVDDFEPHIEGLKDDMQMSVLRLETLLRLLADQKALVDHSFHKA